VAAASDLRPGRPASWAAVVAVSGIVALTVLGGYAVVRAGLRPALDPGQTVRAYAAAQSDFDCERLAELATSSHFADVYCPPENERAGLDAPRLEVAKVTVREQSDETASVLAEVVVLGPDGSSFSTAVSYTLVRDGDLWLVDSGRDPRPTIGGRSVRFGS